MDWDSLITSQAAAREYLERYYQAFRRNPPSVPALLE
jgi:hypothetical protein